MEANSIANLTLDDRVHKTWTCKDFLWFCAAERRRTAAVIMTHDLIALATSSIPLMTFVSWTD